MDCKEIQDKLLEVRDTKDIINSELLTHMESCHFCQSYYDNQMSLNTLMGKLQTSEPVLNEPSILTSSIMDSIKQLAPEKKEELKAATNSRLLIYNIQRLLAAASVLLLVWLGVEQFIVIDKINRLENHISQYSKPDNSTNSSIQSMALKSLFITKDISQQLHKIQSLKAKNNLPIKLGFVNRFKLTKLLAHKELNTYDLYDLPLHK